MTLRNLVGISDARVAGISAETRFGAAYADQHFRHPDGQVIVLDELRKQRHLVEYSGDTVPESAVAECIAEAEALLALALKWLETNRPELIA